MAVYAAVARTATPTADRALSHLSRAADHSKISMAAAAALWTLGGPAGRRAAVGGMVSVAVTSAVVNGLLKPLGPRRRPDRVAHTVPVARHVAMPRSSSFPSGHAAAAFAFATGVGDDMPATAIALRALAGLVAYSRVHTGVHYPGDVVTGALIGSSVAQASTRALERRRS